jgi:hypothetical protein
MRVGSVKSGSSAETSTEAGRWYRQPIVWLGGLVFAALLAGITLTVIVSTRFQDEPLPVGRCPRARDTDQSRRPRRHRGDTAVNAAADACWHCSEPLPQSRSIHASVGGQSRAFCCHGCQTAAEWIERLGLADYYRLRTAPAQTPREPRGSDAWRRPELEQHVVRELGDGCREVMLMIDGVRCSGCAWLIECSLMAMSGVERVSINAAARRVRIVWRPDITSLTPILENLGRIGYSALPLDARSLDDSRRRESRAALKRLLVAAVGAMQAMMFAAVLYFGAVDPGDASTRALFHWFGFLVATPVVLYSAQPFFMGAARALRAGHLGMDVPSRSRLRRSTSRACSRRHAEARTSTSIPCRCSCCSCSPRGTSRCTHGIAPAS